MAGSNESIANPAGTVSSIWVVFAFSFSVGTESVNCCNTFAFATGGLTIACADAPATRTSAAAAVSASTGSRRGLNG